MTPPSGAHQSRPLGQIFDEVPWLYDRARPGYPDQAIDALLDLAELRLGDRVLEVGAGTGQLTVPLLRHGLEVTALEPGPRMAAFLRRKIAPLDGGRVVTDRFEDVALPDASFDAVLSATAFHWVDPERRYRLAARVLRPGGSLGLIRNDHVLTAASAPYYRAARASYERHAPEMGPPYVPPRRGKLPGFAAELEASGLFDLVGERRFAWDRRYTADDLIQLLRTYSNHRAMRPPARQALFRELRDLIDHRLGGSFLDRSVTTVCVGRVRQAGASSSARRRGCVSSS